MSLHPFNQGRRFINLRLFCFSTDKAPFPSLTVCPHYNTAYRKDILSGFNLSVDDVRRRIIFPKIPNLNNISLTKLFESFTHSWKDLIVGIVIKTGLKMENTNYTIFLFAKNPENITNGKLD